jgi:hypothetical protein
MSRHRNFLFGMAGGFILGLLVTETQKTPEAKEIHIPPLFPPEIETKPELPQWELIAEPRMEDTVLGPVTAVPALYRIRTGTGATCYSMGDNVDCC